MFVGFKLNTTQIVVNNNQAKTFFVEPEQHMCEIYLNCNSAQYQNFSLAEMHFVNYTIAVARQSFKILKLFTIYNNYYNKKR